MTTPPADRLTVAVIDDEEFFRLGVCSWLRSRVTVAAEAASLAGLELDLSTLPLDLVLYGANQGPAAVPSDLQALKAMTDAPVLGLGPGDPAVARQVQRQGGQGYWVKGSAPEALLAAMTRVAAGDEAWGTPYWRGEATAQGWFAPWRQRLYASGMDQIEAAIADLEGLLASDLSPLDRAVVAGRRRELRAARRAVAWLLSPRVTPPPVEKSPRPLTDSRPTAASTGPISGELKRTSPGGESLVLGGASTTLFEALDVKLQSPLRNQTRRPLEIDILREERRRELLYAVRRAFADLLGELQQADVQPAQVLEPQPQSDTRGALRLLQDLWQRVVTVFFGKYYVISIDGVELEVVPLLLLEAERVRPDLEAISGVSELVGHLLFQHPLQVDSVPHGVGSAVAMARAEHLLDNLVVCMANAVIQPLLNQLADVEVIKQSFYSRQLLSSRSIAQFRNDLSWHYRLVRYWYDPLDIFESRVRLFRLGPIGVEERFIYMPRRRELERLQGLPFTVTLLLELRDALAPRFQALVSWAGKLAVYLLTEVLGRGLGLIGRGILRGIGSAWQDVARDREPGSVSGPRR
ncbi:MAG: DUF3685 domain-containing protein [Cyanobacteria bacterium P01_A01_bin.135]